MPYKALCKFLSTTVFDKFISYIVVSSAYISTLESFSCTYNGKSLINNRNNSGPRMDPCATPQVVICLSEIKPLTLTDCVLLVR